MANTDKNFDQYFKERLAKHEEKPSQLAWEKLERQLPKKEKGIWIPLMGIAATLLLFLAVGYVVWQFSQESDTSLPLTAEITTQKGESLSDIPDETEAESLKSLEESTVIPEEQIKEQTKPTQTPGKKVTVPKSIPKETPKELLAEVSQPVERTNEVVFETPEIIIPELDVTEAIAQNDIEEEEEVMTYKITIKSNGIKETPEKQGLIAGIENKVDKIGGLLNKVEQGFADLQDAKDNLFVSNNTSKRERK
jgi:cytoskeletal protein RodZ